MSQMPALIRRRCEQHGWEVVALQTMPDHVHRPTTATADVVKEVKAITSHELRAKYPYLLDEKLLRRYSNVSRETVAEGQVGVLLSSILRSDPRKAPEMPTVLQRPPGRAPGCLV